MTIVETIVDLVASTPRDRQDSSGFRRRHAPEDYRGCCVICIAALAFGAWLIAAAVWPYTRVYQYTPPRPESAEIAEIARLGDLIAAGRRSGDKSSAARAEQSRLYKRLHQLEKEQGKDFTR